MSDCELVTGESLESVLEEVWKGSFIEVILKRCNLIDYDGERGTVVSEYFLRGDEIGICRYEGHDNELMRVSTISHCSANPVRIEVPFDTVKKIKIYKVDAEHYFAGSG